MPVTTYTESAMAAARNTDPATISLLNPRSMRSLSCSRKRSRWCMVGAMSIEVPMAVQMNGGEIGVAVALREAARTAV